MPRRKIFSEAERHARLLAPLSPEEHAARRQAEREILAEERRQAGLPDAPVENEMLKALTAHRWRQRTARPRVEPRELRAMLRRIGAAQHLDEELLNLLADVQYRWRKQKEVRGTQPTPGEMKVIFDELLKPTTQARDFYNNLPLGLLWKVKVPLTTDSEEDPPALGLVLNAVVHALEIAAERYKPTSGKLAGERAAAQQAAWPLVNFMNRKVPDAPDRRRQEFIFRSMRALGIPCPDLDKNPGNYTDWFREIEVAQLAPFSRPSEEALALMAEIATDIPAQRNQITYL
jgi:hypothetical protein